MKHNKHFKRFHSIMLASLLLGGSTVPFGSSHAASAREKHRVKACHKSNVLLPQHSDVQILDRLYQDYLGRSLPYLDLGLEDIELARAIVTFDKRITAKNQSPLLKTLSDIDALAFEKLKERYRREIARLEEENGQDKEQFIRTKVGRSGGSSRLNSTVLAPPSIQPAAPIQSDNGRTTSEKQLVRSIPAPSISKSPAEISRPPVIHSVPDFNTEEYARVAENPFFIPTQTPLSTFSIDVDTASYSNVRRFLKRGQMPPKDAVRIEEMINYFSYDYAEPKKNEPFSINTEVSYAPWNTQHQLVQIGLKGKELETPKPSNLVFLVDVSGSMRSPNKLQLLQRSLCMMVREMKPTDHVTLVTYAGNAGLVLEPTSGREKSKILKAIDQLQAGGSTAGAAGINLAYDLAQKQFLQDGNNRVILATDGDFNVGISSNAELERLIERKRKSGIFLTVLGFGTGNYKDSKMEILANKGNGNYAYIDTLAEARKVLVEEITSTLFTIAKDVKIQVEFNPEHVQAYRLIGYENRVLRDQDFNNDQIDAGEIGAGHTVTALYEVIPTGINTTIELPTIDALKYQKPQSQKQQGSSELMQVKLRYKQPQGAQSSLITHVIENETRSEMSQNLQRASTVAMFGMHLRNSKYKGSTQLKDLIKRGKNTRATDPYWAEFTSLLTQTHSIQDKM